MPQTHAPSRHFSTTKRGSTQASGPFSWADEVEIKVDVDVFTNYASRTDPKRG